MKNPETQRSMYATDRSDLRDHTSPDGLIVHIIPLQASPAFPPLGGNLYLTAFPLMPFLCHTFRYSRPTECFAYLIFT